MVSKGKGEPMSIESPKSAEYLKGFADGREAQKQDDLADLASHLDTYLDQGEDCLFWLLGRRITESGSNKGENQ